MPLKVVASCNDEVLPESTAPDKQINYVEISDVSATLGIENFTPLLFAKSPSRARRIVRSGDILVSTVRTYLKAIASVQKNTENLVASTGFAVIRPSSNNATSNYLGKVVLTDRFIGEIISRSVGVSYPAINASEIMQIRIPLPPVEEQQKIAQFLDFETAKINALIDEQKRLIELLKEKRQAVISHAVTKGLNPDALMKDSGVEWIGEVPQHWRITKLKFFVTTRKGIAFKADDFVDEGIPVVKASDIKESTLRTPSTFLSEIPQGASKAILNAGDIIISTVGSLPYVKNSAVGQICRTPGSLNGALLNQNTAIIDVARDSSLSKEFLFLVMSSQGFREHLDYYAHGTANQASLNVGDILEFEIPLPHNVEQKDIYRLVDKQLRAFDSLVQQSSRQAHLLKERRSALISAAVTGKIDVRDWQPPQGSDTVEKKESAQTEMQHG